MVRQRRVSVLGVLHRIMGSWLFCCRNSRKFWSKTLEMLNLLGI